MHRSSDSIFYRLNGIPSRIMPSSEEVFFYPDKTGEIHQSRLTLYSEVQNICTYVHDLVYRSIYNNQDLYYKQLRLPNYISTAGLSPEAAISKESFEGHLSDFRREFPDYFEVSIREMYLYDLQKLISGIQGCNEEINSLVGLFYQNLNMHSSSVVKSSGTQWSKNSQTVSIHLSLNFIYIRMYSILDYMVKLFYEVKNFQTSYTDYIRLRSNNMLFGDRSKLKLDDDSNTVFERCDLISEIETLRNYIIHDSYLDELPRIYVTYKDGIATERFILKPDMTNGRLHKFKNRRLFYGSESKWNLSLPDFIHKFQERQINTLNMIVNHMVTTQSSLND